MYDHNCASSKRCTAEVQLIETSSMWTHVTVMAALLYHFVSKITYCRRTFILVTGVVPRIFECDDETISRGSFTNTRGRGNQILTLGAGVGWVEDAPNNDTYYPL